VTDVLWLAPTWPWSAAPIGGIFFRTQATALARLGLGVTVACATPLAPWPLPRLRPRWKAYADAPDRAIDDGVTVVRPRYPNLPGEPRAARPDRFIARAAWRRRIDWRGARLVHGHYAVTGMAARRVARRAGLPYVLTFHGSDMNRWPDEHPEQLDAIRATVREADVVIAVSAALAERVREVTGRPATNLPIGVDHAALAAGAVSKAEARAALGLSSDGVIVLYVGNLLPAKGVPELAAAIRRLGPAVQGIFVGAGDPSGVGIAPGGADGLHVMAVGPKSHEDVVRYLCAADVLVLASHSEGLPTIVVEAGSLGLPVIGSRVGGIPELLGDDRGTLLPDISAAAIEDAVNAFVSDPDRALGAAVRLREHVRANFDVDRNAARLLEIYRQVAPGLAVAGRDDRAEIA
jgi:teichuronic acid biosynthesis glycosyltransferase TuaC